MKNQHTPAPVLIAPRRPDDAVLHHEERAEIRTMTPELCRMLVGDGTGSEHGMNTRNRTRSTDLENLYAEEMRLGYWRVAGQGITVTRSGVLADGQTRVHAVMKSGRSDIRMLILWDAEDDVVTKLDSGRRRTMRHIMHIVTGKDATVIPAALQTIMRVHAASRGGGQITADEILSLYDHYIDAIEAVMPYIQKRKGAMQYAAPHRAAFIMAAHVSPKRIADIAEFAEMVYNGVGLEKNSPALTLRNYIIASYGRSSGGTMVIERYLKTLSAIRAHLEGRDCAKLYATKTVLENWPTEVTE